MPAVRIEVSAVPNEKDAESVVEGLRAFNLSKGGMRDYRPLQVFLRDAAHKAVGGVLGATTDGSLFVHVLWVAESHRGCGYGRALMAAAEEEALRRRCTFAHLDTYSYQARGFYERLGYEVFGTLVGYRNGLERYFMRKWLPGEGPSSA